MKPSHILFATGIVALVAQVTAWLAAPVITQRYVRLQHVKVGTVSTDAGAVGQGQGGTATAQSGRVATVLSEKEAR